VGSKLREDLELRRERAVLATVVSDESPEEPLAELQDLAETAGVVVVGAMQQRRNRPDPRTWFGKGKIEELAALAQELEAGVVIVDHDLSPQQLRNIEEAVKRKVIDRSELILDIFANRATTREAQLQV
jgi:GTP-binding protein HflX